MAFSGHSRLGKTGSHTAAVEVSSCIISEEAGEHRWLSKNSRQAEQDQSANLSYKQCGGSK